MNSAGFQNSALLGSELSLHLGIVLTFSYSALAQSSAALAKSCFSWSSARLLRASM